MTRVLPSLFEGVNDVDLRTARRRFEERTVADGEVIFADGEPARGVVFVEQGAIDVVAGGVTVGTAGPGSLVGEMALWQQGQRTAAAIARGPGRLLVLQREGYEALRDVMHPVAATLEKMTLSLQVTRMRDVSDRIAELSEGDPVAGALPGAGFFATVAAQFGRGGIFSSAAVDKLVALRRSPVFADATDEALAEIAQELQPAAYGPGHFLCTEGKPGSTMYLLEEGQVDVVVATPNDRVQHLVTLEPGAAFGMGALAHDRPRMASCIAKTRVVVLALGRDGWERLANGPYLAASAFRRAMILVMAEQLAFANRQLAAFSSREHDTSALLQASLGVEAWAPDRARDPSADATRAPAAS